MYRRFRLIPWLTLTAFWVFILAPPAFAEESLGRVVDLVGKVTVTRGWSTTDLAKGDLVYSGDVVEASRNSSAELVLGSGHHVKVKAGTKLRVSPLGSSYEVQTFYGSVLAAVVSSQEDARGFRVSTPTASGAVRGTLFTAEVAEDGATTFRVLFGEVTASDAAETAEVVLGPQTKTTVAAEGTPTAGVPLTSSEIAELEAWAGELLSLGGVSAAESALETLTAGVGEGGAGGAATFPWVLVGAVGAVAATAAIVYLTAEPQESGEGSTIDIDVNW
ncbi:MAG TPA: FecR domain-containing protein [bacterium]|nr:FecR domain-containing protein [bacterium]